MLNRLLIKLLSHQPFENNGYSKFQKDPTEKLSPSWQPYCERVAFNAPKQRGKLWTVVISEQKSINLRTSFS